MKRLLITLVALALGMTAFAQYGPGHYGRPGYGYGPGYGSGHRPGPGFGYMQDGVFEFGITLNHFTTAIKNGSKAYRPDRVGFFGEYRVDISPMVDMGLQLSTTFGKGSLTYDPVNPYGDDMWYWQGAPLIVTDVNLLPYSGFNPYVGIGVGAGFGYEKNTVANRSGWIQALVISPRAGVELFECLRMSVQYQWYLNSAYTFSHVSFGLSWAFHTMGGGRRPMHR
ncbi:MAG: hypothetical protein IJP49_09960 [Bacteroidales bacterium]|nr:hypothetical protein [Bacteroidales bacterium]